MFKSYRNQLQNLPSKSIAWFQSLVSFAMRARYCRRKWFSEGLIELKRYTLDQPNARSDTPEIWKFNRAIRPNLIKQYSQLKRQSHYQLE